MLHISVKTESGKIIVGKATRNVICQKDFIKVYQVYSIRFPRSPSNLSQAGPNLEYTPKLIKKTCKCWAIMGNHAISFICSIIITKTRTIRGHNNESYFQNSQLPGFGKQSKHLFLLEKMFFNPSAVWEEALHKQTKLNSSKPFYIHV